MINVILGALLPVVVTLDADQTERGVGQTRNDQEPGGRGDCRRHRKGQLLRLQDDAAGEKRDAAHRAAEQLKTAAHHSGQMNVDQHQHDRQQRRQHDGLPERSFQGRR